MRASLVLPLLALLAIISVVDAAKLKVKICLKLPSQQSRNDVNQLLCHVLINDPSYTCSFHGVVPVLSMMSIPSDGGGALATLCH